MGEFTGELKYDLSAADRQQVDDLMQNVVVSPEQHYAWVNATSSKKTSFLLGYDSGELVSFCALNESNSMVSAFLGPISTNTSYQILSIRFLCAHYKNKMGLLTVQLPNEIDHPENSELEKALSQELSFRQYDDTENWSSIKNDLHLSEEEIWKNIKSNHKGSIKKARKLGVVTKQLTSTDELQKLAQLFDKMYVNRGLPKMFADTNAVFQNILGLTEIETIIMGVFTAENVLIGGVICPILGNTIHYKYGVSDFEYRKYPALHLALYDVLLEAKAKELKWFDLGGYNHFVKEGDQIYKINLFKRSFGGQFTYYPKKMYFKLNPIKYFTTRILRGLYFFILKRKGR